MLFMLGLARGADQLLLLHSDDKFRHQFLVVGPGFERYRLP